jgi:hypothetical protein
LTIAKSGGHRSEGHDELSALPPKCQGELKAVCIINHTHKFIFVHIPKCGGTSVTHFMARFSKYCDLEIGGTPLGQQLESLFFQRHGLRKHSLAKEIKAVVGQETWDRFFKFSFVRNPFSRAVSTYRFLRRWRNWEGSQVMDSFPTFDGFVLSDFWSGSGPDRILSPQSLFLEDVSLDYLGHIETFRDSLMEILRRLELPFREADFVTLPHELASPPEYRPLRLAGTSIARICNRYQLDFVNFGYAREVIPELTLPSA